MWTLVRRCHLSQLCMRNSRARNNLRADFVAGRNLGHASFVRGSYQSLMQYAWKVNSLWQPARLRRKASSSTLKSWEQKCVNKKGYSFNRIYNLRFVTFTVSLLSPWPFKPFIHWWTLQERDIGGNKGRQQEQKGKKGAEKKTKQDWPK